MYVVDSQQSCDTIWKCARWNPTGNSGKITPWAQVRPRLQMSKCYLQKTNRTNIMACLSHFCNLWCLELDSMCLLCPFQVRIFYLIYLTLLGLQVTTWFCCFQFHIFFLSDKRCLLRYWLSWFAFTLKNDILNPLWKTQNTKEIGPGLPRKD